MLMNTLPSPNEVLVALLDAHGYRARVHGERVEVEEHDATLSAQMFVRPDAPQVPQLDVRVHLRDGRTLVESFAGVGDDERSCLAFAFDAFTRASFHVLLAAFFGYSGDLSVENWRLPGARFRAIIGSATFLGQFPSEGEELVAWFEPFAAHIQRTQLSQQAHWFRLLYAHHKNQTLVLEALLDNEAWPEAQNEMARYLWPQSEEFYSARVFLVLLPDSNGSAR